MADDRPKKRRTRRRGKDASVDEGEEGSKMQQIDAQKKKGKPGTRRTSKRKTFAEEDGGKEIASAQQATVPTAPPPPLVVKFAEWANQLDVQQELVHALPPTKPAPSFEANPDKNRYQDVVCLEETRVKLVKENPNDTDYIHANWIKFKDHDRTYIATQGPLENTIEDFWRMVWQEQSPIVVSLITCCENGKAKCAQYWPDKEGTYKQRRKSKKAKKKLNIFVLEVLPEGCSNSLIVRMLQTTAWPDGHVMHSSISVLKIIKSIFKGDTLVKGPVVIHCSAGIGRTGTLVLVDYILFTIFTSKQVSLKKAFLQLRSQRASSIQRESQFIFVVVAIMGYIAARYKQYDNSWKTLESDFNKRNNTTST